MAFKTKQEKQAFRSGLLAGLKKATLTERKNRKKFKKKHGKQFRVKR